MFMIQIFLICYGKIYYVWKCEAHTIITVFVDIKFFTGIKTNILYMYIYMSLGLGDWLSTDSAI